MTYEIWKLCLADLEVLNDEYADQLDSKPYDKWTSADCKLSEELLSRMSQYEGWLRY